MKKYVYNINNEKFINWYNKVQEIHGNISIITKFCKDYEDIDEFYQIIPLLKHTNKLSDKLYCEFINMKGRD